HLAPLGPDWLTTTVGERALSTMGAGMLLLSWPLAIGLFWKVMGPSQRRPIPLVLLVPVILRVALAGPGGLAGELVADAAIFWLGAAMVVASLATLTLLRPRLDIWVMIVVGVICLMGSMFFYYFYEHGFGELEDGLGGLLQSLFGFSVPYPSYVDDVKSAALMMGLFFMFVTVYSALVSGEDRIRGVSLGLMLVAGLGLSSPHLALMLGVGALLLIETLLPGAPHRDLAPSPYAYELENIDRDLEDVPVAEDAHAAAVAIRACFESLAERLHLPAPTIVETEAGPMLDLRHELDGVPFDLRARAERTGPRIDLSVGLLGRESPVFELVADPGDRGQRPAHLLARSHRIVGDARALERYGDAPLDAMTSFRSASLRAWDGGVQVELGRDLAGLRVDDLEALACRPSQPPPPQS
ncbi:MAG: hypothetical protein KC431_21400, partial [Myxococcales bacterium]|nr:hypothetical protein [Myxococcales bacterium]